jgi:hypothetical protein
VTDYAAVLTANYAGSQWALDGNDYSTLQWFSDTPKPTQAELDAAWPQVQYNNNYAQIETNRRLAYETKSDGLFFEWQRGDNTEAAWRAAVAKVKSENPYPPKP